MFAKAPFFGHDCGKSSFKSCGSGMRVHLSCLEADQPDKNRKAACANILSYESTEIAQVIEMLNPNAPMMIIELRPWIATERHSEALMTQKDPKTNAAPILGRHRCGG